MTLVQYCRQNAFPTSVPHTHLSFLISGLSSWNRADSRKKNSSRRSTLLLPILQRKGVQQNEMLSEVESCGEATNSVMCLALWYVVRKPETRQTWLPTPTGISSGAYATLTKRPWVLISRGQSRTCPWAPRFSTPGALSNAWFRMKQSHAQTIYEPWDATQSPMPFFTELCLILDGEPKGDNNLSRWFPSVHSFQRKDI
jgi:hypothetical protein